MRKRPRQEHGPQRVSDHNDLTRCGKGRMGDCPGPTLRPRTCLNFHSDGGGGGPLPPGPPPPLLWTPSPPPPSAQVQLKTWGLGTFFGDGEKISRRLRRTPHTVYLSLYVYSAFLVLQITMTQRSLSVYFCSPVQPSPLAKRKDVIDALLYFRFKDRITGRKRQEAYNEAQKACVTLFLSVPMATLVRCLPFRQ